MSIPWCGGSGFIMVDNETGECCAGCPDCEPPMTHDELQAIKARADAATLDPWLPGAPTVADALEAARTDVPALITEVERLRKALLKRGAAECYQCGTILDDDNRHISGLMCIPCALPVIDDMK